MDRGSTSAMARWRQRRDRGADDPVNGEGGRGTERRGGSSDEPPAGAAAARFFEQRRAAAVAGDESAMSRWRERLRRGARRTRATVVEPRPDAPVDLPAAAPCPEVTAPAAGTPPSAGTEDGIVAAAVAASPPAAGPECLPLATDTEPVASRLSAESVPAVDDGGPQRCTVPALIEPALGSAPTAAAPAAATRWGERLLAGGRRAVATAAPGRRVGEVAVTLRGKAASAMARWRQRRGADARAAAGPSADGVAYAPPLTSELVRDILRLAPAVLLCVIGIALTYGVCVPVDGAPERLYWRRQIAFLAAGLGLYAVIGKLTNVPVSRRTVMRVLYGFFCVALPVLVLLLGHATGNGLRWLSLFGLLSIQPAEFAKIALIWVVAELVNPDQPLNRVSLLRRNLLALLAVTVPMLLVFMERSMGNTALLCLSVGAVLGTRWFSWPILMGLLLAGVLGLAPLGRAIIEIRNPTPGINLARLEARNGRLEPERLPIGLSVREVSSVVAPAGATGLLSHCPDRFACYLSQNGGWNARQALRCVRLGGVEGSGYRRGNITILGYLPRTVQHTDFIYCVLSESFGFWGGLVVLGLIGWLIVVILWTGVHSRHPAAWSFSVGFATLLFLQTLIHVGMALRLLPIIGIPLPFVSYGGSFLVTSFAALGLVARYDGPVAVEHRATVPATAPGDVTAVHDRRFQQPDLITV